MYSAIHCNLGVSDENNLMISDIVTKILTLYHVSKGLKFFGEYDVKSVIYELKHLHEHLVIHPVSHKKLTCEQKLPPSNT